MIIEERIIKRPKSSRSVTDNWPCYDKEGIVKYARTKLLNKPLCKKLLDMFLDMYIYEEIEEKEVSQFTTSLLTHIITRGYRVKDAFIKQGIDHEVYLIRKALRDNIYIDLSTFNIYSLLNGLKLYIKEDLKFFIPHDILKSIIRNKADKNYMLELNTVLFTIKTDKRSLFKKLINIFFKLEYHDHLYEKYSLDFVLAITEVLFPNFFKNTQEISANFDIIQKIINFDSMIDHCGYRNSAYRVLVFLKYK